MSFFNQAVDLVAIAHNHVLNAIPKIFRIPPALGPLFVLVGALGFNHDYYEVPGMYLSWAPYLQTFDTIIVAYGILVFSVIFRRRK